MNLRRAIPKDPPKKKIVKKLKVEPEIPNNLTGLTICITGKVGSYTRSEIEGLLRTRGARVAAIVNLNTDYLVIGYRPGQRKVTAASRFGIKTLSSQEVLDNLHKWA